MSVLIKNCFSVSENRICDILCEKDKISFGSFETADEIIDGKGLHAFGGFVDLHSHLRDPGLTYKEDILTGTKSAAAGGFTTVCAMPNTKPACDSAETVKYILNHEKASDVVCVAAITKGMEGKELTDFEALKEAGAGAFSDDGLPVYDGGIMREAMFKAKNTNSLLMLHEEDLSIRGKGVVNEGENARKAGLCGIPASTEEVTLARDIVLSRETDCPVHICHISTKGSADIIRAAKKEGVKITCETQPHYVALDDSMILDKNTNFKVNPPVRSKEDVKAITEAIKDGTVDAIATDHAPHSEEEKANTMEKAPFGMIGFETAFSVCYEYLVKEGVISLKRLNELLSENPKKILGIEDYGITLCDLEKRYVYKKEDIVSKSKNSPYIGKELMGQAIYTIKKGEIIYDRYTDR